MKFLQRFGIIKMHNFLHKIQNVDIMCIYPMYMAIHFDAYPMLCHGKHAVNACVLTYFQYKVKNYFMKNYNLSYSYNL